MGDKRTENGLHVVIIGAGVSGLLLAQGLQKNGISFEIFDREESAHYHRAREWGMSVQWAFSLLSEVLPAELLNQLHASASVNAYYEIPADGNYMPVYNVETGEHNVPLGKVVRVSRRKMRTLCSKGIDIKYGRDFQDARTTDPGGSVIANFKDGTSTTGDLIVGADGAQSTVRSRVFGAEDGQPQQIPYTGINMHICFDNAELSRLVQACLGPSQCAIAMHPKGYWLWLSVQDVPDPEKPEGWTFHLQWTWKLGTETAKLSRLDLANLQAEAKDVFAEPFRSVWMNVPLGTKIPRNNMSIWPPLPVPDIVLKRKVALVGDAGHAMSFHRGQGLNHGIADAVKLTKGLAAAKSGHMTMGEAVNAYEMEMIKRAGEEVAISKMNTEMVHDWERLQQSPFMQRGGAKNP